MTYACIRPSKSGIKINTNGQWKEVRDDGKDNAQNKRSKSNYRKD